MAMKVAIGAHSGTYGVPDYDELTTYVIEAEKLGVDTAWTAENWNHDSVTPIGYLAAKTERVRLGTGIMIVGIRTPGLAAMTAATLMKLTRGRFILGLGTSGPQVYSGWHGMPFEQPVKRTREYIEVIRRALSGNPLEYEGEFYRIPVPGSEGKKLRPTGGATEGVPIWLGAIGPKNLELLGEMADGWIGTTFIPENADMFFSHIRAGAERAGRKFEDIELQASSSVWFTEDVDAALETLRGQLAFSLGAMGSRQHNFYNAAYSRQGYGEVAKEVQRLYLDGRRGEARELVPVEMAQKVNLVGTDDMVKDRLRVYRDSGIHQIVLQPHGDTMRERLDTLGRAMDIVNALNAEKSAAEARA